MKYSGIITDKRKEVLYFHCHSIHEYWSFSECVITSISTSLEKHLNNFSFAKLKISHYGTLFYARSLKYTNMYSETGKAVIERWP